LSDFSTKLQRCGLSKYVTSVDGRSSEIAKTWRKPIDRLFIDGSHDYEDVLADFQSFSPCVKPGGVVAFHDVIDTWPGVLKVWTDVASVVLRETSFCATLAFGRIQDSGSRKN
jgi:predicted O-methyltransferase YrrM